MGRIMRNEAIKVGNAINVKCGFDRRFKAPSCGIVIKGIEEGEIYLILEESEMQTRRLEIRV